jgi:hypothetical protein
MNGPAAGGSLRYSTSSGAAILPLVGPSVASLTESTSHAVGGQLFFMFHVGIAATPQNSWLQSRGDCFDWSYLVRGGIFLQVFM